VGRPVIELLWRCVAVGQARDASAHLRVDRPACRRGHHPTRL